MKILKVIHGYPPTYNAGSEVYSKSICEELTKGHEVQVFTREQDEYRLDFEIRKETNNNIFITIVNLPREKDGYEHPLVNRAFRELLIEFQPDVVHIGHLNHLSLGIVREVKKLNIAIVFTLHDFWLMCPRGQFLQRNFDGQELYRLCGGQENQKCATNCYRMIQSCREQDETTDTNYWTDWIERRMQSVNEIIPLIDIFIAPSQYLKNRFINNFGLRENQIQYLDYGFPLAYLKPIKKEANRPFTFAYIGTHIPAKGVNLLIEAFKKTDKPSRLMIWGRHIGQNTASLKRLAKDSFNPIIFKNEYENPNITNAVFQHVDVVVVPSIWGENSPLVIHEAQACHVPVITADFGGMKEYVQHQVNGLLFEHRNSGSLYQQMQWAIEHPKETQLLGNRGYLYSDDGKVPCIKEHCQSLELIYQKVINNVNQKRTLENNY